LTVHEASQFTQTESVKKIISLLREKIQGMKGDSDFKPESS